MIRSVLAQIIATNALSGGMMVAFPGHSAVLMIHEILIALAQQQDRIAFVCRLDGLTDGAVAIGDEHILCMVDAAADPRV